MRFLLIFYNKFVLRSFLIYNVGDMLPVMPHWENNILHTASFEWTNYEFFYTAAGGEQYLTFGCFRDYDEMEVVDLQTSTTDWNNAYYLFDDFSVERSVSVQTPTTSPFNITVADFGLNISTNAKGVLSISNSQGQEILRVSITTGENRIHFDSQASGIYYATLFYDKRRKSARFFWR